MKTGYDSLKEKYDIEKIKVNNLNKTCDELQMERTRLTARKKRKLIINFTFAFRNKKIFIQRIRPRHL